MTEGKKNNRGNLLVLAGIVLLIIGVAADPLGLGSSAGMGYKQITMLMLGLVMILIGYRSSDYCQKKEDTPDEPEK